MSRRKWNTPATPLSTGIPIKCHFILVRNLSTFASTPVVELISEPVPEASDSIRKPGSPALLVKCSVYCQCIIRRDIQMRTGIDG